MDQVSPTTVIYANATRWYTASLMPVARANKDCGLPTLHGHSTAPPMPLWESSPSPFQIAREYTGGPTVPHLSVARTAGMSRQRKPYVISLRLQERLSSRPSSPHQGLGHRRFRPLIAARNGDHGGIEGGSIGDTLGATLISGVATWFVVHHRRAHWVPSTADTRGEIEQLVPDPLTTETPRLYDPLDPTTYPRTEFQPQRFGSTSHLQPCQLG
ncbi:hypothetical protein V8E53_001390 [Lactarius tabidus]